MKAKPKLRVQIKVTTTRDIGTVPAGSYDTYKNHPGNFHHAAAYAHKKALKLGEDLVIIPGNSYGWRIYHIARLTDDPRKFTAMDVRITGAVVTPNGKVSHAILTRIKKESPS